MTGSPDAVLALRLAAPLQSWGGEGRFNRRDTRPEPTKSGVTGLLAAAAGRAREQDVTDLLALRLGVRVDQPGTLLRDYHTVSDYRNVPLLSAKVNAKGQQQPAGKSTHITERFYLQDAVFVATVAGPAETVDMLAQALKNPAFPLALGRRSCPPSGRLVLGVHYDATVDEVLDTIPWQAAEHAKLRRRRQRRREGAVTGATVSLPTTVEDPDGTDQLADVPSSFSLGARVFTARRIRHGWANPPAQWPTIRDDHASGFGAAAPHDPFALLDR
ncbi:type I-E CRISPR-associated protein Cas5/CasD [Actinocrinis puniceicyclus]|uniref:Type I-E CRISPR-associated protein Cas5/CasD n=1 Tax=Actinocrinis puniceicyclus TaxID=977794 RepID=A0A8J7WNH4_9ACTN|nr:type I-E CRISPR-associated protein Cas5/CasD [Actinocrinis puniceicyclus]MBS2965656.1 type I-E CRISPR-associated protein Cas5/CasD [Actinocrinis puniceicyclus]